MTIAIDVRMFGSHPFLIIGFAFRGTWRARWADHKNDLGRFNGVLRRKAETEEEVFIGVKCLGGAGNLKSPFNKVISLNEGASDWATPVSKVEQFLGQSLGRDASHDFVSSS